MRSLPVQERVTGGLTALRSPDSFPAGWSIVLISQQVQGAFVPAAVPVDSMVAAGVPDSGMSDEFVAVGGVTSTVWGHPHAKPERHRKYIKDRRTVNSVVCWSMYRVREHTTCHMILRASLIEMFCSSRIRQNLAMNNARLQILANPATLLLSPRGVLQSELKA